MRVVWLGKRRCGGICCICRRTLVAKATTQREPWRTVLFKTGSSAPSQTSHHLSSHLSPPTSLTHETRIANKATYGQFLTLCGARRVRVGWGRRSSFALLAVGHDAINRGLHTRSGDDQSMQRNMRQKNRGGGCRLQSG
jgi:hypothetical protein